ncbi:MAG: hypothetical protein RLP44_25040 [Aggregatilineales bacterium]
MDELPHSNLDEIKTQAALLLKQVRSSDPATVLNAAKRFQQLSYFAEHTPENIAASAELINGIKLKHALHVLALEHNFPTWTAFKTYLERKDRLRSQYGVRFTMLYPQRCASFINEWHASYEIASTELGRSGGYLLPYKSQFFICEAEYIERLGLDPDDPDWERIGYNWVQPADQEAFARLDSKLRQLTAEMET